MAVALFDTETPLAPLRGRIREAVDAVLDSGRFILGPQVAAFETELAAYLGAGEVVGVANGTDALVLALRALGVGPGDDVVVPSFTFYASAEAIALTGARPVFCDIDLETFCVTPETVRAALTPATRAVVAVDLFGGVPDIAGIAALGVPVVEDAAQALGTRTREGMAGALGTIATLSFFPSKNLGAFGDAGAVISADPELAERVRMLRFHGSHDKQTFELVGHNSRLDELQAAILRVLLGELDTWAQGRRDASAHYARAGIAEHAVPPATRAGVDAAWHLYVVRHPRVEALEAALAQAQVACKAYYRRPVHEQPAMRAWAPAAGALPATDEAARTHLALPMSAVLSAEQAAEVVAAAGKAALTAE